MYVSKLKTLHHGREGEYFIMILYSGQSGLVHVILKELSVNLHAVKLYALTIKIFIFLF